MQECPRGAAKNAKETQSRKGKVVIEPLALRGRDTISVVDRSVPKER